MSFSWDWENVLRVGVIDALGGKIEASGEVPAPTASAYGVKPSGIDANGQPVVNSDINSKSISTAVWVGGAIALVLVVVLIVVVASGGGE